jgi:hypothetical protein
VCAGGTAVRGSDCGPLTSRRHARLLRGPYGITGFDATCGIYSGIKGSAINEYRCAAGVDTLVIYTDTTGTTEWRRILGVRDTLS